MRNFIRRFLPCQHDNITWPMRMTTHDRKRKLPEHVVCLDCKRTYAYDWTTMQMLYEIRQRTT